MGRVRVRVRGGAHKQVHRWVGGEGASGGGTLRNVKILETQKLGLKIFS